MKRFNYKVINEKEDIKRGIIHANSMDEAIDKLIERYPENGIIIKER